MSFSEQDLKQIAKKGMTLEDVNNQLLVFRNGLRPAKLHKAATIGNGILKLTDSKAKEMIELFDSERDEIDIIKFVPASGGATRMFKFLFEFLEAYDEKTESFHSYIKRTDNQDIKRFWSNREKLPFFKEILDQLGRSFKENNTLSEGEVIKSFVRCILDEDKLNLGEIPKGLISFHKDGNEIRTAFEEHFHEAIAYASSDKKACVHFTVSEKHLDLFENTRLHLINDVFENIEVDFDITFSVQKASTDTLAVTPDNIPFRSSDKKLLFRPSGHGALLYNLNALNADIVFIKNIDNVVSSKYVKEIAKQKCMLAGVLLELQKQAYEYLKMLFSNKTIDDATLDKIQMFMQDSLNISIKGHSEFNSRKDRLEWLRTKLNRPMRVCGMVKNEGQPGGGPFWVEDEDGTLSLQIVESSQVDKDDEVQQSIFRSSTHFNPVDLVCGIRDFKERPFDLNQFVDKNASFISEKTHFGKPLKALELPGLWNGSMANWITVFVEVPLITFNPVKTVNDLFNPTHQGTGHE